MTKKILFSVLAVLLLCSGCAGEGKTHRVETVVWIPVNPTEHPQIQEETTPAETEEPTEEAAEETTEQPVKETEGSKKPASGGKKPSGGNSNKNQTSNNTAPKETEPVQTEPVDTKPAETEPAGTESTETETIETESTETEPVESDPPETEPEKTIYDISGYSLGALEYGMIDQINTARGEESHSALNLDGRLSAIASCRAYELAQLWSHTRPDGRSYATVLEDYGYGAGAVTELLVYGSGSGDAAQMVSQWLASESHKANLLSDGFSTVGIGVYRTNGITYVCCLLVR